MSAQKEDYRTNRADYLIAKMQSRATDDDSTELLARKKRALWLRDRRFARLAANPCESWPGPRTRLRG